MRAGALEGETPAAVAQSPRPKDPAEPARVRDRHPRAERGPVREATGVVPAVAEQPHEADRRSHATDGDVAALANHVEPHAAALLAGAGRRRVRRASGL